MSQKSKAEQILQKTEKILSEALSDATREVAKGLAQGLGALEKLESRIDLLPSIFAPVITVSEEGLHVLTPIKGRGDAFHKKLGAMSDRRETIRWDDLNVSPEDLEAAASWLRQQRAKYEAWEAGGPHPNEAGND